MLLYQEVRESLLNGTRTAMSPLPTAPIYKTSCAGSSTTPRRNRLALLLQRPPLRSVCCLVTQLCLILFNSMDCSRPGSSVLGISQVRILECVSFRGPFQSRDRNHVSCITGGFFTTEPPGKPLRTVYGIVISLAVV